MKTEVIYVIDGGKFGKVIEKWAEKANIQVMMTTQKNNELSEIVDSAVLFHENHNFSKEDIETQTILSNNNKAIHKVDISGTLSATYSNFNMWIERNRPQKILFIGDDEVVKNPNLPRFLAKIKL